MNTFTQTLKSKFTIATIAVIAIVFGLVFSFSNTNRAHAAGTTIGTLALHGYAWSSTIGWISMNCAEGSPTGGSVCSTSNYAVQIDTDAFSGYAWSSNVGWISFNNADLATCSPSGPQRAFFDEVSHNVTGWARVISGTDASGADGCIRMSGGGTSPYAVTYDPSTHAFGGFAWGSVNTGWLSFAGVTTIEGAVHNVYMSARYSGALWPDSTPLTTIPSTTGGTFYLVWASVGMASCNATAGTPTTAWTGSKPTANPADYITPGVYPADIMTDTTYPITVPPNTGTTPITYTYTITCHPTDSTPDLSSTIRVVVAAPTSTETTTPALTYNITAVDGVAVAPTTGISIDYGQSVTIEWQSHDIQNPSCVGSSSPSVPAWNGSKATSATTTPITYSYATGPLTAYQTFTLKNCLPVGSTTVIPPRTLYIEVNAPWCEVSPTPTSDTVTSGTPFDITSPFGVIWHGPFTPTTISVDTSATSFTSAFVGSPVLTTSTATVGVEVLGTTTTSQTVTVNASGGGTECRPASYIIAPRGTTGLPGHHRPPWIEF